jgi:hypothetical protein
MNEWIHSEHSSVPSNAIPRPIHVMYISFVNIVWTIMVSWVGTSDRITNYFDQIHRRYSMTIRGRGLLLRSTHMILLEYDECARGDRCSCEEMRKGLSSC